MVRRHGFTLIELIFVIVITALIATFGTNMFMSLYDNYLRSKAIANLTTEVDKTLDIIEAKLRYRIKPAVIGRTSPTNDSFVEFRNVDGNHLIIEWIGESIESKNLANGDGVPGWSGLIDTKWTRENMKMDNKPLFYTPSSRLSGASDIIKILYGMEKKDKVKTLGLIFKFDNGDIVDAYGFDKTKRAKKVLTVKPVADDMLEVVDLGAASVSRQDQYYLSHTAYALVPSESIKIDSSVTPYYTLNFYYNYQPWTGESYKDGTKAAIAEYVSQFNFKTLAPAGVQAGKAELGFDAIAMKLCIIDGGRSLGNKTGKLGDRAKNLANTKVCKMRVVR